MLVSMTSVLIIYLTARYLWLEIVRESVYFDSKFEVIVNGRGDKGLRVIRTGKHLIGMKWEEVEGDPNDSIVYLLRKGRYGLYNLNKGQLISPVKYTDHGFFSPGANLCPVIWDDTLGFIDGGGREKKFVFPLEGRCIQVRDLHFDQNKRCVVPLIRGGKLRYGLIDETGRLLTTSLFDEIQSCGFLNDDRGRHSSWYRVRDTLSAYGLIDSQGSFLLAPTFGVLEVIDASMYVAGNEHQLSLYASDGTLICEQVFTDRVETDESAEYIIVEVCGNFGAVDRRGKLIIKPMWDFLQYEGGDVFMASLDGFILFINHKGEFIQKPQD